MSKFSNLSIKTLEAFQAIIQTGTATAAAKQLEMTQPGISRLLSQLEEFVGFQLFYREKSRLVPTDEALALTKEISLTLDSIDRVSNLATNLFESNIGELKVIAPNSFIAGPLSDAVVSFLAKYPSVKINLDSYSPEHAREMIAHKSADCGFIQLPEEHPGILSYDLVESEMVCAVPKGHVLASNALITPEMLENEYLVLLGKGRFTRQKIESAFQQKNIAMKVRVETHTVSVACSFAKNGTGIAIVNRMLAKQYADNALKLISFSPQINLQYGFITSAHAPMNRLTKAFFDHVMQYFKAKV